MKNKLIFDGSELRLLEKSIEEFCDDKDMEQRHLSTQMTILEKTKDLLDDPTFNGHVKTDEGIEAIVPIEQFKQQPEMLEALIKDFKSKKKSKFYYKELALNTIKKLHEINTFLEKFDALEVTKVKEEVANLTNS
jgi:ubiquinone biosynthesis protein Coq4